MNIEKIPQTDSIQELAQFWDTNDLTDFAAQLEEVTEPVFIQETVVPIRLKPLEAEAVQKVAQLRGIDYTELIREWILEKLQTA